jgi:hypothetical protein
LSILTLVFQDQSRLRRFTGLAPPLVDILQILGFPPADHYLSAQV